MAHTLADIVPSVAWHLGAGGKDTVGLPHAQRYVLVLVDGLGWANLFDSDSVAPVMRDLPADLLRVGMPSTTATSLVSLTTGVTAGQHGVVGYSFRIAAGAALNTMSWDQVGAVPERIQKIPTWFEQLAEAMPGEPPCAVVVPAVFAGSGMTRAALRGAQFVGVPDEKDWAARLAQIVDTAASHRLTYVYERSLDHIGHLRGVRSAAWLQKLAAVDAFIGNLRAALPPGTGLLVTGDHGMVDVPKTHHISIEDSPALAEGVDMVAGEARLRHVYTADPPALASRWQAWLGDRALVRLRDDAMPWFGAASPDVAYRVGDVVVAALADWAVLTLQRPREANLIGMHGSVTQPEQQVALLKELT